jgi:DNA polymerase-3 subunit gamma/tau
MGYQVLARKWRPKGFADMVGQQHVVQALSNALKQNRLHHAHLFTGTRGVGKTTVARIIAKCLNCETSITHEPCEKCSACTEINAGRFIDLIEVDAASRTKVEDTRELLDNVQYAPTKGRFKVYLIDEVHMLSGHSFNALLKTLEEPPPHVKFLLATTDPQKLPMTVLSRCLQFHLKNLTIEQISTQLAYILEQEQLTFETPALQQLARAADGSMRDALSLLDQAIAHGDGRVNLDTVRAMLGTIAPTHLYGIIEALINNNAQALYEQVQSLSEFGVDFAHVMEELLGLLHQMALLHVLPNINSSLFSDNETPRALAKKLTAEQLQLYYQIAILGRRDLPMASTPRSGFEMTLLRMLAFYPEKNSLPPSSNLPTRTSASATAPLSNAVQTSSSAATSAINTPRSATTALASHNQQHQSNSAVISPATAAATTEPTNHSPPTPHTTISEVNTESWETILPHLKLTGAALAVAQHCTLQKLSDHLVTLQISSGQAPLINERLIARFQETLSLALGRSLRVEFKVGTSEQPTLAQKKAVVQETRQQHAESAISQDKNVQAILNTFGATIIPNSIEPSE